MMRTQHYEWTVDVDTKKLGLLVILMTYIYYNKGLDSQYVPPRVWEVAETVFAQTHTVVKVPPETTTPVTRLVWETGP